MKDKYSDERVALLHPAARQVFTDFINECEEKLGVTLRITMGLRTISEQNDIYAQGRTRPGNIVTNAKGGSSFHNYGLAVDLAHVKDDGSIDWKYDMSLLNPIAKEHGLEWGGNWIHITDRPHFELRFGFLENCSDAFTLVNSGQVDENGYVNIPKSDNIA